MFVVTDLTRFAPGNPNVCTALVELATGRCVRPMPYFKYDAVKRARVIPGAVFTGSFSPAQGASAPHAEDCDYSGLTFHGPATRDQFYAALVSNLAPSISEGFGYRFRDGEKVIPVGHGGARSIITIRVSPSNVEILPDRYNDKKIKIEFCDASGARFRFMPITDLGFYDHASKHRDSGTLAALNTHLRGSAEVLLRVGLSRQHAQGERDGYWVQVNGIYTFPSRLNVFRGYE